MHKKIAAGIVVSLTALAARGVQAQPALNRRVDADQRIEQDKRMRGELERQRERSAGERVERSTPAGDTGAPLLSGQKFHIERIRIVNDPLTQAQSLPLLTSMAGKELGSAEVFGLIRGLTDYYAAQGYGTTLVTLEPQNLATGELALTVRWGYIAGLLLNGQPVTQASDRRRLAAAWPGVEGEILNVRDIDQMIENLSATGKSVRVRIVPAEREDYSYLNVVMDEGKRVTVSGSLDNSNQYERSALARAGLQVGLNDLLSLNETFSVGVGRGIYAHPRDDRQHNWFAGYAMPIGRFAVSANVSQYDYGRMLYGIAGKYDATGWVRDIGLRLSYVLARGRSGKTLGWMELGLKDSQNEIAGVPIAVNSKRYRTLGLGLSRTQGLWGGVSYADVVLTRGLDWLGADGSHGEGTLPQGLFTKVNAQASWQRDYALSGGRPLRYTARLSGQYTDEPMPSGYAFYAGDEYTVRGFVGTPLQGDRGAYLSNSLRLPLPCGCGRLIQSLVPVLGVDAGVANPVGHGKWRAIVGAAAGVRLEGQNGALSLMVGQPIHTLAGGSHQPVWYAGANFQF